VAVERQQAFVMPTLPDSVLGQMAVIMRAVRTEVDSMNNVITRFNVDTLRMRADSLMRFDSVFLRALPARALEPMIYHRANVDSLRMHFDSLRMNMDSTRVWIEGLLPAMRGEAYYQFSRAEGDSTAFWRVRPSELVRSSLYAGVTAIAGADLADINPGLGEYFGTTEGVLVLRVPERTPAARAGLLPGDVITEVNGTAVRSIPDIRRAAPPPGTPLRMRVLRKGQHVEVSF
jgi:hypothetical protein